jgi:prepilin-type N-terminal cleavage/methylation domain-containing protein
MIRKGFTLIELLVVIAIIAILAAILFPVFAQAKLAAKKASDLSNLKQIGLSSIMYINDYDDTYYPHRINCYEPGTVSTFEACPQYLDGNGNILPEAQILGNTVPAPGAAAKASALSRYFYVYNLYPYTKNYNIFKNPATSGFYPGSSSAPGPVCSGAGCTGEGYGGQNSYGHNDMYLSPAAPFGGGGSAPAGVNESSVPRVASTVLLTDGSYYGAAFDVTNQSGLQNVSHMSGVIEASGESAEETQFDTASGKVGAADFYIYYWKNIGGSDWSYSGGEAGPLAGTTPTSVGVQNAITLGKGLFSGATLNAQFADGHAKATPYSSLVGDVCFWTTDVEAAHPLCH